MDYKERYRQWLDDKGMDPSIHQELEAIKDNDAEIEERFYSDIQFGTAGLRGLIRAGSNSMNLYNVKRTTQALAEYIKQKGGADKGVVIGYDSRNMSVEFADAATQVLCANGIRTYLFNILCPVPLLSFAVRHLNCAAGVEITASHNPAPYNGYKVYASCGGQLAPEGCRTIMDLMNKIQGTQYIKDQAFEKVKADHLFQYVGTGVLDEYIKGLAGLLDEEAIAGRENMAIVYTPLHGTGNIPVQRVLEKAGFTNVHIIKEQQAPDGDFPTVNAPNPEDPNAFGMALDYAKTYNADIVTASDPDADRYACAVKTASGYTTLNGNQIGALLMDYILGRHKAAGTLPMDGLVCKSIVSTNLANRICAHYSLKCTELLTGFRYISEQIDLAEKQNRPFLFGFEESYGLLTGNYSRDKDAVLAIALLCEAAAHYAKQNMTLLDAIDALYRQYGYYCETQKSIQFEGAKGQAEMKATMEKLREEDMPQSIAGIKVSARRDYLDGIRAQADGAMESIDMPSSDVLYYEMEGDNWFCLRPSGTEPKLKIYFAARAASAKEAQELNAQMQTDVEHMMKG